MKKIFIIIILIFSFLLISCSSKTSDDLKVPTDIPDTVSSYTEIIPESILTGKYIAVENISGNNISNIDFLAYLKDLSDKNKNFKIIDQFDYLQEMKNNNIIYFGFTDGTNGETLVSETGITHIMYADADENKINIKLFNIREDSFDEIFDIYYENGKITGYSDTEEMYKNYLNTSFKNFREKDYEKALENLHKTLLFRQNMITYFLKGLIEEELEEYDKSIDSLTTAVNLSDYYDAYLFRGISYYRNYFYNEAEDDYKKVLELKDDHYYAYFDLGLLYYNLYRNDEAAELFKKAIQYYPGYSEAYYYLGNIYSELYDYATAEAYYNTAIEISPYKTDFLYARGNLYYDTNDNNKAINDYSAVLEIDGTYISAYLKRGYVFIDEELYDYALSDFSEILKLDPQNDAAVYSMGYLYYLLGNYEESLKYLNTVTEENSFYAHALNIRGNINFNSENYYDALEDYTKATEVDPEFALAYYHIGNIYFEVYLYEDAIEYYTKAIELYYGYEEAYYNRGLAYYNIDMYSNAIEDLNSFIYYTYEGDSHIDTAKQIIEYMENHIQ